MSIDGDSMRKRLSISSICLIAVAFLISSNAAATKKSSTNSPAIPDKAYLQKIWDGWATLDPAQEDQFHAQGQHTFYDETPLKYDSWAEYRTGVVKVLAPIKSATFTVNDDAELRPAGNYVWGTATVKEDVVLKSGKRAMDQLRWTVVFEKLDGKWLIVHEHISGPTE
jgi:ketosteroid isomerase-like protein